MSFVDDVVAESRRTGTQCKTCRIVANLDPKDRIEVETVLADPNFVAEAIARVMTRRGWEVGGNAIRTHRRNCLAKK